MDKKRALSVIYNCAKKYDENLKNQNIMFIIENRKFKEKISFIETIFYIHNFLHLTGIDYNSRKNLKTAKSFYSNLLKGKISYKNINYKNPITTEFKLEILYNLCAIDKTAKFTGTYNNSIKDNLYTEKVIGNIRYCFGLVKDKKTNYYMPNSAIQEDIRNITNNMCNIVAILKKEKDEKFYSNITYIKNNFDLNNLFSNEKISELINFNNLKYNNEKDLKNYNKVEKFRCNL